MLGKLPHRKLRELSKKYRPIMFLRVGSVRTVVASSPEMVKKFLKTHDLIFASRPSTCVGKYMAYFMREEEIAIMHESVMKQCGVNGSNPVNISNLVSTVTMDIICRMTFGRKYSEETLKDRRGFKAMIQEALYLSGEFNIADFIPYLEWMDLQGLGRRQKHTHKTLNDLFEKIIQEHEENKNRGHRDFVDVMVELSEDNTMDIKITRDNIKAIILDMLASGTDPFSTNLEWEMFEMLLNPSLMKKVQDELESIVGLN
eukprot:Gb_15697 [translate_table: standard]